jgi:hypothetical protein
MPGSRLTKGLDVSSAAVMVADTYIGWLDRWYRLLAASAALLAADTYIGWLDRWYRLLAESAAALAVSARAV